MISEKTEVPNQIRGLDGWMRRARNPLKRAAIELLKKMLENNAPPAKIARQIALVEAFPA